MLGEEHRRRSVYRLRFGGAQPTQRYANARKAIVGANPFMEKGVKFAIIESCTGRELTERELERRADEEVDVLS
jgi:hypothetical protein